MDFGNFFIFLLLLFIIFSTDKSLSVDNLCEKNGKIRPTFVEIFGKEWENDQNELNLEDSIGNDQFDQYDDQQKHEVFYKFHAIKEKMKKRGKYSKNVWAKIEQKIAKKLGISRHKIYKWKKELGINEKNYYELKKQEFIARIEEFKRMSKKGTQKQFAKELGIGKTTLRKWKKEFGIKLNNGIHSNEQKMTKMNDYLKMKKANPSLSDKEISAFLKISLATLKRWKQTLL